MLEYDKIFRQRAAIDPTCQWHELDAGLFATTVLSARTGPACYARNRTTKHRTVHWCICSLHPLPLLLETLYAPPMPSSPISPLKGGYQQRPKQRHPSIGGHLGLKLCKVSWNKGVCVFLGTCSFCHVCRARGHKALDCLDTPPGSEHVCINKPSDRPGSSCRVEGPLGRPSLWWP